MAGAKYCTIDKSSSRENYDNGNYNPSDGGKHLIKDAIRILQSGSGGTFRETSGRKRGFMVSYNSSENDWLKKEFKL